MHQKNGVDYVIIATYLKPKTYYKAHSNKGVIFKGPFSFICCCSIVKSGLTLCNTMDYSTSCFCPPLSLEFAQIHVH